MSIGGTLAQARRQAGLTITQVSEQTRIRASIISSIEHDDFSSCGGDFYARGHIRSIAGAVGADPVALIGEYDQEQGQPGDLRAAQVFEPAAPIRIHEPRRPRLGRAAAVAVIAAAGFAAYHLLAPRGPNPPAAAVSRLRHSATATPRATLGATRASRPAVRPQAVIRLTASQACWVSLSASGGKLLFKGTIQAGSTMTWHEERAVSLVVGNPPGIDLTVNGTTEQMNTVQVVTLSIDPRSTTPVTIG